MHEAAYEAKSVARAVLPTNWTFCSKTSTHRSFWLSSRSACTSPSSACGREPVGGSGDPWFVARKDLETNTLYVVQGHDHPWLLSSQLRADHVHWIAGSAPTGDALGAKTRYRQSDAACRLQAQAGPDELGLVFDQPQWAITPGQSAVLYRGDVCLGGGLIASAQV